MLCHQPKSDTSYVSLSVRAGHFYDPEDCQGLAHLLEHMLFMGSRHFPKPNAINSYIEQHGGSINAWTGTEYANYHYHCDGNKIIQTLPAFANMIRQPILDETALVNEINAIDAEFHFKKKTTYAAFIKFIRKRVTHTTLLRSSQLVTPIYFQHSVWRNCAQHWKRCIKTITVRQICVCA